MAGVLERLVKEKTALALRAALLPSSALSRYVIESKVRIKGRVSANSSFTDHALTDFYTQMVGFGFFVFVFLGGVVLLFGRI